MRIEPQPGERKGLHSTGSDLDRKFWVALVLYAAVAHLVSEALSEMGSA